VAVEEVEAGRARAIIAERPDRFFRDLDVQREVIRRVEAAGGRLVTLKGGALSHATAEAELQANLNGSVNQYVRRTARDRSWDAVELAIAEGKWPGPHAPTGYVLKDQRLRPDPKKRRHIKRAFEMRADGKAITEVHAYLRKSGIRLSLATVTNMLRSETYLGQIHHGTHTPNLKAHDAIIDQDLYDRAQRAFVPRGRKPASEQLLARLGVLRCASCGSRMTVGQTRKVFRYYRCPNPACMARATISVANVEPRVIEVVKAAVADVEGRASAESGAREAAATAERARDNYEAALEVLEDFTDPAAVKKLRALREKAEAAEKRAKQLGGRRASEVITAARDWDRLTLDARREIIRAVVERVVVSPGRGPERVRVELVGE
jgi:DNA invertase Pin-like site-specific DNA recombinase